MLELEGSFGKQILEITGGHIRVDDEKNVIETVGEISKNHGVVSQVFDAEHIAGREHLIHAVRLALIALESGENFADSPNIELVCWVAGTRQIDRAVELVGIRGETTKVALIVLGLSREKVEQVTREISQELQIDEDEEVLDITPEKSEFLKEVFSISDAQLEAADLEELVLERIALLSLQK